MGTAAAVVVGVVLMLSGAAKLFAPAWPAQAAELGAPRWAVPVVPWVEVVLGSLLAAGVGRPATAWLAAALLTVFTVLVALFLWWIGLGIAAIGVLVAAGVLGVLAVTGPGAYERVTHVLERFGLDLHREAPRARARARSRTRARPARARGAGLEFGDARETGAHSARERAMVVLDEDHRRCVHAVIHSSTALHGRLERWKVGLEQLRARVLNDGQSRMAIDCGIPMAREVLDGRADAGLIPGDLRGGHPRDKTGIRSKRPHADNRITRVDVDVSHRRQV